MIAKLLNLGQTPAARRIIAALILYNAAIGKAFYNGSVGIGFWIDLSTGLTVSTLALAFLHFRWRKKEAHDMTPDTIEDTFS